MAKGDLHILLVEDSSVMRRLELVSLSSIGRHQVTQAADAQEALQLLDQSTFDVLITDYYMPGIDGIEFVKRVREDGRTARLPIIMVTSEADPFVEREARDAGVDEVLLKPLDPRELRRVLASITPAKDDEPGPRMRVESQDLLDSIPYPAMILDAQHNVVLGNAAFWTVSGRGLDDRGIRCAEVMHHDGRPPADCPLYEAIRMGGAVERQILEGSRWMAVSVYPIPGDNEDDRLFLHLARPVE